MTTPAQPAPGAIKINQLDNVASLLRPVAAGAAVVVASDSGRSEVMAREAIKSGFKIALVDIASGDHVIKYGSSIGSATTPIAAGELVHVHNLAGLRAGGDTGRTG